LCQALRFVALDAMRRWKWRAVLGIALVGLTGCRDFGCDGANAGRVAVEKVLVAEWGLVVERGNPFDRDSVLRCAGAGLPARVVPDSQSAGRDSVTFLLTDSAQGRFAIGYWRGGYAPRGGGVVSLALGFRAARPGLYVGTLTFGAASPTTVRLRVTDWVAWPAGVIFLGVLLSYAMQQYRTSTRSLLLLRMRVDRIPSLLAAADKRVAAILARASLPVDASSLQADVTRQLEALDDRLDNARLAGGSMDASSPDYVAACTALDALEQAIAQWPLLAEDMVALAAQVKSAREIARTVGRPTSSATVPGDDPPLVRGAAALLARREILTSDVASTRTRVQDATAALAQWRQLMTGLGVELGNITTALNSPAANNDNKIKLAIQGVQAGAAAAFWQKLYDVPDATELTKLAATQPLDALADALRVALNPGAIPAAKPSGPPAVAIAASAPGAARPSRPLSPFAAFIAALSAARSAYARARASGLPASERGERLARSIRAQVRTLDAIVLLFTLAASVVTGLDQLYYGKPFGTLRDYLLAFVWGFTAKTLLDATLTTLSRVAGTASPNAATLTGPPMPASPKPDPSPPQNSGAPAVKPL
jgi:hypothetical protein